VEIRTANGDKAKAIGSGTVDVETAVNGKWQLKTLMNVWYVPNVIKNLFSVLAAHDKNEVSKFISEPRSCSLMINGKQVLFGARQLGAGLYKVALRIVVPEKAAEVNILSPEATLQLYHEWMGHTRTSVMSKVSFKKNLVSRWTLATRPAKAVCMGSFTD